MTVGWVIQRNFDDEPESTEAMIKWCKDSGTEFELVDYIPFSNSLPSISIDNPIFYGNTSLIRNAIKSGYFLYFDKDKFALSAGYNANKGMFFNRGTVTTVKKFLKDWDGYTSRFIRPDEDLKIFAGDVFYNSVDFNNVVDQARAQGLLNNNTKIVHSNPTYDIYREWRCVIVDKKVISISLYNTRKNLTVEWEDDPVVWTTAQRYAEKWTPSPVCIMDIATTKPKSTVPDEFYGGHPMEVFGGILEFNCFHGAGWYANDIPKVMKAVTAAFSRDSKAILA